MMQALAYALEQVPMPERARIVPVAGAGVADERRANAQTAEDSPRASQPPTRRDRPSPPHVEEPATRHDRPVPRPARRSRRAWGIAAGAGFACAIAGVAIAVQGR